MLKVHFTIITRKDPPVQVIWKKRERKEISNFQKVSEKNMQAFQEKKTFEIVSTRPSFEDFELFEASKKKTIYCCQCIDLKPVRFDVP